jgi:cobalamin biosynthetic protein CobC
MLTNFGIGTLAATDAAPEHGGDLAAARRSFPGAPEPFVDLSTGINPHAYPLPPLPPEFFARLPESADVERLAAAAAQAYGAPSASHVVAAPGAQMLLPFVARLLPPGRAAVLSPTYSEHARAAALAGHAVTETAEIARLAEADLAVMVNPNNPNGRIIEKDVLRRLAKALAERDGLLVVDQAFMDVGPLDASLAPDAGEHLVVLRSFGKFFGLAGLRLGFALTGPRTAARLRAALGPWAVSGPAIAIGTAALSDTAWIEATRERLKQSARRLDRLLGDAGLTVIGGTSLYRLASTPLASELFERLGRAGILVRRFDYERNWLRFGLPRNDSEWERLRAALLSKDEE